MYDLSTMTVKNKTWTHLPACTSAFRWLEHYYCFHGNNFTRFNPKNGEVNGPYPKDARRYFMNCTNFSEFILIESVTLVSCRTSSQVSVCDLQDTELVIKSLNAAMSN